MEKLAILAKAAGLAAALRALVEDCYEAGPVLEEFLGSNWAAQVTEVSKEADWQLHNLIEKGGDINGR